MLACIFTCDFLVFAASTNWICRITHRRSSCRIVCYWQYMRPVKGSVLVKNQGRRCWLSWCHNILSSLFRGLRKYSVVVVPVLALLSLFFPSRPPQRWDKNTCSHPLLVVCLFHFFLEKLCHFFECWLLLDWRLWTYKTLSEAGLWRFLWEGLLPFSYIPIYIHPVYIGSILPPLVRSILRCECLNIWLILSCSIFDSTSVSNSSVLLDSLTAFPLWS